jgi:hypothetical protein
MHRERYPAPSVSFRLKRPVFGTEKVSTFVDLKGFSNCLPKLMMADIALRPFVECHFMLISDITHHSTRGITAL